MIKWGPSLLLACGCVGGSGSAPLPAAGSVESFAEWAQPVFAARCANPSCHGNAERPLSLYAVHRHRMNRDEVYLDAPLNDEELEHNLVQASLFVVDIDEPSQSLLLTKPLGDHAGVSVFIDSADYDYLRLHAWIETVLEAGGVP